MGKLTRESWHVNTVGTLDFSDDTVGEDVGGSEGQKKDWWSILHFESSWLVGWLVIKLKNLEIIKW